MREKEMTEREKKVIDSILENKIIAIIRGVDESKIKMVAEVLHKGGIKLMEITFNMSDPLYDSTVAKEMIAIKELLGDRVMIGAGTVMTAEQVDIAYSAHADFIISPNTDLNVIRHTKEIGLVSIPGAFTASEIVTAQHTGADFVKVFPASVGGEEYIKAITAPLSGVRLLAVGGVDEKNIRKFLDAGCVGAGIGGQLVNKMKIAEDKFDEIEETARRLVECVR